MKQLFVPKEFNDTHLGVIDNANSVIRKYQAQGYDLTLRQLFYQFIANDLFPDSWLIDLGGGQMTKNHERNYKKLGSILNDARLAGHVDWSAITDRTRELVSWRHETSVADALERLLRQYALDMWETQPCRVEVWVEKEALAGVVERICGRYDVPYFSCRGYTSASSAYGAYQRVYDNWNMDQKTIILHFGDHDPSGIDMTRDITDRLELMVSSTLGSGDSSECFEIRRLALNWEQVTEYNPPPSPAKITDSRAGDYIAKFGEDSWELDALPPDKIADLVKNELETIIDHDAWADRLEEIDNHKETLQQFIDQAK